MEDLLVRPRGRPRHVPLVSYRSFEYQTASWHRSRRVIAKVEDQFRGLFPRVGSIVTTLTEQTGPSSASTTARNRGTVHRDGQNRSRSAGAFIRQARLLRPPS
jgi:hypothetical protein